MQFLLDAHRAVCTLAASAVLAGTVGAAQAQLADGGAPSSPTIWAPRTGELVKPAGRPAPTRPKLPRLMDIVDGSCANPVYPAQSLRDEQTGTVDMAFLVDVTGNVIESKIMRSSGFNVLNEAALSALRKCKFVRIDHAPIQEPTWTSWTYVWSLE